MKLDLTVQQHVVHIFGQLIVVLLHNGLPLSQRRAVLVARDVLHTANNVFACDVYMAALDAQILVCHARRIVQSGRCGRHSLLLLLLRHRGQRGQINACLLEQTVE